MSSEEDYYHFRVPIASSIYPRLSPKETLSALVDGNKSLPPKKRLPAEILLLINEEVHPVDSAYAEIRSKWTPCIQYFNRFSLKKERLEIRFDTDKKTFWVPERDNQRTDNEIDISCAVSSADLLYRVRCLFPKIFVYPGGICIKTIWQAGLLHNQSGLLIIFSEYKALVQVLQQRGESGKAVTEDTLRLLNTLFSTVDGIQFTYYHPTAYADLPTPDQRYLAVPGPTHDPPGRIPDPYCPWWPIRIPVEDLTSSTFKSLLPRLKYDPKSRKVDLENGIANLTTIMSSSLLFYRLLCPWVLTSPNVINDEHTITSVWQVELQHKKHDVWLLFIDDRGLFDIRVEGDENTAMDDIVALVDNLFSDDCAHPDGVVAGSQ